MIEIVYSKENDKKDEYIRLPKNIRQIGIPDETRKIYIEDYAITFINQFAFKSMEEPRAAVLVGYTTYHNSCEYIFVSGVVEAEDVKIGRDNIEFSEQTWTGIYGKIKKYFPNQDIVGWFLSSQAFHRESGDAIIKAHIDNFAGNDKVFMKIDQLENEEIFYVFQSGHFVRQMGYYIYYEKNEEMQEYMVQGKEREKKQEERSMEQVEDNAAKSFRSIIQERKDEKHQKKMATFMYSVSTLLVMIVVVIGITMINNYDKMKNMEQTLNSISQAVNSEKIAEEWFADKNDSNELTASASNADDAKIAEDTQAAMSQSAIPVENVSGDVEKKEEQAAEETDSAATEQTDTQQQTSGVVTEVNSTEEEMQKTLEESSQDQSASTETAEETKTEEPQYYTIQKGDTLAKISMKIYNTQDMVAQICELNNIKNDNKIQAGQKILLP
ncbi:LysM peptidoglycan-binding domain-containing protein [Konateibacter massiliensis]|uniref:LysM peptidoglycan-binding domain-containing protein n=1 Tax=Konateibacter massiliensis TaxID=2002841 RepID=UPI000C15B1E5|nr:LysM domain-containing protein [Konateibacter massiliensis]